MANEAKGHKLYTSDGRPTAEFFLTLIRKSYDELAKQKGDSDGLAALFRELFELYASVTEAEVSCASSIVYYAWADFEPEWA
jgi:hypothetical protein